MPHVLRAVLFDMDGTLVETEGYWGEAMSALAVSLGVVFSAAGPEQTVGTSMRVAMGILFADLGLEAGEERVRRAAAWVEEEDPSLMGTRGIAWRPGARELVTAVRAAGVATALVT